MYFYRTIPSKEEKFIPHDMYEMLLYAQEHYEPLTEEQILKLVKKDLEDLKIDITKDDYDIQNDAAFRKLDEIYIAENKRYITEAWFIEKYIVGQERLLKKYGCYAMGVQKKLTSEEEEFASLFRALDFKYGKDGSSAERNIMRNDKDKKGLIARLDDAMGFNIYGFTGAQRERLKLIYLLYCFERDYRLEFTSFIANPTLENVDNLVVNDITKNGSLMSHLKRNIIKEVNPDFVFRVNITMVKIIEEWEEQLKKLMLKVDGLFLFQTGDDLTRAHRQIMLFTNGIQNLDRHGKYKHSLLESFFLMLAEHENIGREMDIIDVTERIMRFTSDVPDDLCAYRTGAGRTISKKDINEYILKHRKELAKLIFKEEKITSNQYKKLDNATQVLPLYLDMLYENTEMGKFVDVPELLIIVALQEIVELDKSEIVPNKFYRYLSSDQRTLNSELHYGTNAFRKSQMAWIARVNTRYNAYNGRANEALMAYEIQNAIDRIIICIFKSNNLPDMLLIHNFFMMTINEMLVSTKDYLDNIRKFEKLIGKKSKKGYTIGNIHDAQTRRFFCTTVNSGIIDTLAKRTGKRIFQAERENRAIGFFHEIELTENYYYGSDEYVVAFIVDPATRKICVVRFETKLTDEKRKIFEENGIYIRE